MHPIYLSYDDEILTTYANAGLLRRAKKGLDQVVLLPVTDPTDTLQFTVEEFQVSLPSTGIQAAQCTCPSHECCKHILSSVLWLQQHSERLQSTPLTDEITASTTEDTTSSVLQDVLALSSQDLLKKIRKAERLLAYQFVQDWIQSPDQCQIEIHQETIQFKVSFSTSPITFFSGGNLTNMLSDLPEKQKNACHLACLAYLFYLHAPEQWQWSKDIHTHIEQQTTFESEDFAFIQELQELCLSFMRQGLSHIAQESVFALYLLNMQARVQNLPRLAGHLRQLHSLFKRALAYDVQVDESQLLLALSRFYYYLEALKHAKDEQLTQLKGVVRREYEQQQSLTLLPLGAEWWQLSGGARGLTVCFWDTQSQCLREVTQARANTLDTTFNMDSVAQSGIWGSSLEYLMEHHLCVNEIQMTETGQINANAIAKIKLLGTLKTLTLEQFKQDVPAIQQWQHLQQTLKPVSLLNATLPRYVFLYVQEYKPFELNELEQHFETWVTDTENRTLLLTVKLEQNYSAKINKLQYWLKTDQVKGILTRIVLEGSSVRFIPCSLLLDTKTGLRIFNLDYDYVPYYKHKQETKKETGLIEQLLAKKQENREKKENISSLELMIKQMQNILEFYANTGRGQFDPQDQIEWQEILNQFDAMGLTIFNEQLNIIQKTDSFSLYLLKARYLLWALQSITREIPVR